MGFYPFMDYSYFLGEAIDVAGIVLLVLLGVYALVGAYSVAAYILGALGTYTIAHRREIRHPWMAWIPYGNLWILGSIADQYQYVARGRVTNRRKLLLGLHIAMSVLGLCILGVYVYAIVQMMAMDSTHYQMLGQILAPMGMIVTLIALAVNVLAIVAMVVRFVCLYDLFASCNPNSKGGLLILSILLNVIEPFLVFASRKRDYGMPPRKAEYAPEEPVYFEG